MKRLDSHDKKIIRLLSADGRMSPATIASHIGLTAPTVRSRIKSLEESGFLKVAGLVSPCQNPDFTLAMIGMKVRAYGKLDEIMDRLAQLDSIVSITVVTGRYDIIAEAIVEGGNAALYELTCKTIPSVGVVDSTDTFVVMSGRNKWVNLPKGYEAWGDKDPVDEKGGQENES